MICESKVKYGSFQREKKDSINIFLADVDTEQFKKEMSTVGGEREVGRSVRDIQQDRYSLQEQ